MAHEFTLSDFGLKLIKAYEGFRPVETTLVSGQRVIGYGHRYSPDEEAVVTRRKAEEILIDDLAPYIALVNENVFAPLSQSQFDAFVSLAFNIGPRAFLSSSALHSLNNGRPLDAAAGFDEWRKSVIDGKTYVVDALVRRRTAEKALFLRPMGKIVSAPRHDIPPQIDDEIKADDDAPVFEKTDALGIVDQAPYEAQKARFRRRDDGPAGVLTLSEIALEGQGEQPVQANDPNLSPIAVAAAEVSDRLDRLIADSGEPEETGPPETNEMDLAAQKSDALETEKAPQTLTPANDGAHEDYRRPGSLRKPEMRTPDRFIQNTNEHDVTETSTGYGAYWTTLILGAVLLAGGAMKWFMPRNGGLDQFSAFAAPVATIIGAMMVLGALYYLLKTMARDG